MRVLIADAFETSGREALNALGCQVDYQPKLTDQQLPEAIRECNAEILVVRSTKVNAAVFESPSLKLVVRAGAATTPSTLRPLPSAASMFQTAQAKMLWQLPNWPLD